MVKTYLQTAITQLQSAMADMQSQIHGMQQNAESTKKELQKNCTKFEQERTMHQSEIARLQDASQRRIVEDRIGHVNRKIDEHKAQMGLIDSETASVRQRKDQLYKNLYNAVGELTRLMSLPDIG